MPATASTSQSTRTSPSELSDDQLREVLRLETRNRLLQNQYDPRPFQLNAAISIIRRRDTALIAPTGSGKTIVLAMPLLVFSGRTSLVISPLQALQQEQCDSMNQLGLRSLIIDTVDMDKATEKVPGSLTSADA